MRSSLLVPEVIPGAGTQFIGDLRCVQAVHGLKGDGGIQKPVFRAESPSSRREGSKPPYGKAERVPVALVRSPRPNHFKECSFANL